MGYRKQNFTDNYTVLTAKMLELMEDGIIANENAVSAKANAPIISQTDITAGTTPLAVGQSYHVYE